jgi:hypothetical protein
MGFLTQKGYTSINGKTPVATSSGGFLTQKGYTSISSVKTPSNTKVAVTKPTSTPSKKITPPKINTGLTGAKIDTSAINVGGIKFNAPNVDPTILEKTAKQLTANKIPPKPTKLPNGVKVSLVSPNQAPSAQRPNTKETRASNLKSIQTQDKVFKKIDNVTKVIKDTAQQGIDELSHGVVIGANQTAPQNEYMSSESYKKAIKDSQNPKFLKKVNNAVGAGSAGVTNTLTLGLLSPKGVPKENQKAYKGGQIFAMAGVPIKSLVKFVAVNFVFNHSLKALTGKDQPSELLPENSPQWSKTGLDLLTILGEAFVAHRIRPGEFRDAFTKQTIEKSGIPQKYYFSPSEVQDVLTGKNTGYQKDILTKIGLTSKDWREAVKSGAQIEIPASKIIEISDRPYFAKIKDLLGMSPTDMRVEVIKGKADVKNIAGLLGEGVKSPEEVINKVIENNLEKTTEGKALVKQAMEAKNTGQNVLIENTKTESVATPTEKNISKPKTSPKVTKVKEENRPSMNDASLAFKNNRKVEPKNKVNRHILKTSEVKAVKAEINSKLEHNRQTANNEADFIKGLNKIYTEVTGKAQNDKVVLSALRSTLNDEMYAVVGKSGSYKKDYATLQGMMQGGGEIGAHLTALNNHIQALDEKLISAQEPTIKGGTDIRPVGEGKEKLSRLEGRIREKLKNIPQEVLDQLGEGTYREVTNEENVARAAEFVVNNPEEALRVVAGEIDPPKGILRNAVFVALHNLGYDNSRIALRLASIGSTRLGQELSVLRELDPNSPVKVMSEILKIREDALAKKYGGKTFDEVRQKYISRGQKKIAPPKLNDWGSIIKEVRC